MKKENKDPFQPKRIETMSDLITACRLLFGDLGHMTVTAKLSYYDHLDKGEREKFTWEVYHSDKLEGAGVSANTPQACWDLIRAKVFVSTQKPQNAQEQANLVDKKEVPF